MRRRPRPRRFGWRVGSSLALNTTRRSGFRSRAAARRERLSPRQLEQRYVDGFGAFVSRLFLVGDFRALGQRAKSVTADTAVVDEEVATAFVGRDEAVALVVAEPLDRASCHLDAPPCGVCCVRAEMLRPATACAALRFA